VNRDQTRCYLHWISWWQANQSTGNQVIGQVIGCRSTARLLPASRRGVLLQLGLGCLIAGGFGLAAFPVQSQGQPQTSSPSSQLNAQPNTQPQAQPDSSTRPILRLGSQGTAVSELQSILKLLGYYTGAVDGSYQASTATAVSAFQQAAGLQPDGVTGIETWNHLLPSAPAISQTASQTAATPAQSSPTPAQPNVTNPPRPAASPSAPPSASPRPSFPSPTATATPAPSPTPSPSPSSSRNSNYTPFTPAPSRPSTAASSSSATASSNNESDLPVLRVGATGAAVTRLQERLKATGLFTGTVDGVFGAETEAAVQQAQRNYNLEPDGIVGPATWAAILQRR
jgi:peptidoglycan hydrolase-like protein with peptidoglycan-binding domain